MNLSICMLYYEEFGLDFCYEKLNWLEFITTELKPSPMPIQVHDNILNTPSVNDPECDSWILLAGEIVRAGTCRLAPLMELQKSRQDIRVGFRPRTTISKQQTLVCIFPEWIYWSSKIISTTYCPFMCSSPSVSHSKLRKNKLIV